MLCLLGKKKISTVKAIPGKPGDGFFMYPGSFRIVTFCEARTDNKIEECRKSTL